MSLDIEPIGRTDYTSLYRVGNNIVTVEYRGSKVGYCCDCMKENCEHIEAVRENRNLEMGEIETKKVAYRALKKSEQDLTQLEQVYKVISYNKEGLSRQEISELTEISINAVCGRIQDLLNEKSIYSAGNKKNLETGKAVEYFKVV